MRSRSVLPVLAGLLLTIGCSEDLGVDPSSLAAPIGADLSAEHRNLVVSGAGLMLQPSRLRITVPALSQDDILDARFYWAGHGPLGGGDDTILIDGVPYMGTLIAAQEVGGAEPWIYYYRMDGLGLAVPGLRDYTISGFTPGGTRRGGIALAVVYRDPASAWTRIRVVEPTEYVRWDAPGHERGAVWNFQLQPLPETRLAKLTVVTADCESALTDRVWWGAGAGSAPGGELVGATSGLFSNFLRSGFGNWLDVLARPNLIVPPNAGYFAYQLESPAGNGDGMIHLFGALAVTGDLPPWEGRIGNLVWNDLDGDGIQDPGEPGLAGVSVTLTDAQGVNQSVATSADGTYEFTGLAAGSYVVTAATPTGFDTSICTAGPDGSVDSDCSPTSVTLVSDSETDHDVDFGFTEALPPLAPGCFFGVGFWKHQFDVSLGEHPGRQHFTDEELTLLLGRVAPRTRTGVDGGDGAISFTEADGILSSKGAKSACEKALQQHFATLLNFAVNGADRSMLVDTDADGFADLPFGTAIDQIEAILGGAAAPDDPGCDAAKAMAESINDSGVDCDFGAPEE